MQASILFQKFQKWGETNAKEHTLSYIFFTVRMLTFAFFGLFLGYLGEKLVVAIQGDQDTASLRCGFFIALQLVVLSTVFYCLISVGRYFDDWLWSTFAGTFFALCMFNAQNRLSANISCFLNV